MYSAIKLLCFLLASSSGTSVIQIVTFELSYLVGVQRSQVTISACVQRESTCSHINVWSSLPTPRKPVQTLTSEMVPYYVYCGMGVLVPECGMGVLVSECGMGVLVSECGMGVYIGI